MYVRQRRYHRICLLSKTRLPIENARVRISRKVRAGSGNGGNSVAGGGSGGGSHGAWSLETEENEIAVFQEELEPGERKEQKQKEFSIPMCLANTAPKICRMELMKLQYPQRLIRRTRLRKFWFRTVKSDM